MNRQTALDRLQQLVRSDVETFKHNIIVGDDGHYLVFDRYEIRKDPQGCQVQKYHCDPKFFSTSRTALSWCIADKYNQVNLARMITRLDEEKQLLADDIAARQHLVKNIQDKHRREAVGNKIDSRRRRLREVSEQLDKCVNQAKYWQIRGFNNETQRTGRTSSHRTNR